MAGGGIRGGQGVRHQRSLRRVSGPTSTHTADVTKTVYHAMGIDDLEAVDNQGRPYNLLAEGRPLAELF